MKGFIFSLFATFAIVACLVAAKDPYDQNTGQQQPYYADDPVPLYEEPEQKPLVVIKENDRVCLAKAMYFEARGEGIIGQLAIASVIFNRLENREYYPDSICKIVYENCQFSWVCHKESQYDPAMLKDPARKAVWDDIYLLAFSSLMSYYDNTFEDVTRGAIAFHATYATNTAWFGKVKETVQIGQHIFYKMKG